MKNQIIYITDEKTLERTLESILRKKLDEIGNSTQDFEEDKLSLTRAAKFAGMSIPTFNNRVKDGVFKKHGTGRKIFFFKSEIIEALKNNA